ncbi:MAG: class I SAM-dependent methyltransferase [Chitinophagaceae bacterium]|jgi:2-polyprenyl-3-methyl-5-hydroxy-6-metoxy-1,4-benzoquinol methylase|nr:class I SAM-dependent methyltransferase [Chitinophagaceae bacterium]
MAACIICSNEQNNIIHAIQELQLGLKEVFHYQLCSNCGTMQLLDVPQDLGKYYPNEDYYSFNLKLEIKEKPDLLRKLKTDYLLFGKQPILGGLLSIGYKMNELYDWVKYTKAQYNDAILDVGTGNGSLLAKLFNIGFTNLTGIDPFINESKDYGSIKILKQDIFEVEKQYDVVMMHHSLEHMFEPLKALQQVYKITKPGGRALVRVPIMGNYGWKTYGEFWCGVDAPRHIFIPSENGLKQLVTEAGFTIEKFYYDSFDYVIWASEQYKKGMALHDPKSHLINEKESMFSKEQLKSFRKKMIGENAKSNGDMAAIYLYKPE